MPREEQAAQARPRFFKTHWEAAELERLVARLPVDTSPVLTVKQVRISGNKLMTSTQIWQKMPPIFNASDQPIEKADSSALYDFRVLRQVIWQPGPARKVSARTVRGLTEYILSVYRAKGYGGIYVYVPQDVIQRGASLTDDVLTVEVVEATISDITVTAYEPNGAAVERGILDPCLVQEWSPARIGEPLHQKKVNDFVGLLNQNPDRYVSAVLSKGTEPNTVALGYDIYEAQPWHFYVQVDNAGTEERQWAPRVGLINTNLTGRDDRFTAMYQAPWERGIEENYALFGSYDVPLFTPRLRLNAFAGYTEFDVTPEGGPFNFLGRGYFYGGLLRYNLMQTNGWFLDILSSLSHERSKVTPELFPAATSDVKMDLFGLGLNLYKSTDMSGTSFGLNRIESIDASDRDDFEAARPGADPDFTVCTFSAYHGRYLDEEKIGRLSGSLRLITTSERLVPAKMTAFGGLYSVRGYDEYEVIADEGLLLSAQYEFDLVQYQKSKSTETAQQEPEQQSEEVEWLRKFAPLVFYDYGRAKIKDKQAGEKGVEELDSIGIGTIVEIGENFSGAVYYGYPLRSTPDTREGKGRASVSLIFRW